MVGENSFTTLSLDRDDSERSERAGSYNIIYLPVYLSVAFPDLWEVSCNWASYYRIHLTATIGFILLYATFLEGGTKQPLTTQGKNARQYSLRRLEWQRLQWQSATVTLLAIPDSLLTKPKRLLWQKIGYSDTQIPAFSGFLKVLA